MVLDRIIKFFSSLRLTVVCLALGLLLVFFGTLAQVDLGLYKAQNEYFRSFVIYWGPKGASWRIPVLPGGYLIGIVLLFNLVAAHFSRFKWTRKKIGIWLVHVGVILLLVGQLLTDMLSRETSLHVREGKAKNYSETERQCELVVIDPSDPDIDKVVAISQRALAHRSEIKHPELPFTVRVKKFFPNSVVDNRAPDSSEPAAATQDIGARAIVQEKPRVTLMDQRDVPSAIIEIIASNGSSLGTWLVSEWLNQREKFEWVTRAQNISANNKTYQLVMRPERHYKPFSIHLLNFQHDVYAGTDIPKNFSSRVLIDRPETGEKREVDIYMNNPLRYAGETFYQAGFDPDDHGTILQVVHNPSWLTPYFSCILVALGLMVQFSIHLVGFASKRSAQATQSKRGTHSQKPASKSAKRQERMTHPAAP